MRQINFAFLTILATAALFVGCEISGPGTPGGDAPPTNSIGESQPPAFAPSQPQDGSVTTPDHPPTDTGAKQPVVVEPIEPPPLDAALSYAIVDTNQVRCWDSSGNQVTCTAAGSDLAGQDGAYAGYPAQYVDNGDGTVTDDTTGLTWQQGHEGKMPYSQAAAYCEGLTLGGAADWRFPTIRELYSLMDFSGQTGTAASFYSVPDDAVPYLNTDVFDFDYGDVAAGERFIDAQYVTATIYVSDVMGGQEATFGVNFADGRIKGYPTTPQMGNSGWFVKCVRGNPDYGYNDLADNGDGTVIDHASGLVWQQEDSGALAAGDIGNGTMDWAAALTHCEALELGGHGDWRLPNAKELQSIVDYTRSPDTTGTAAIDPIFAATAIENELGDTDFGFYWSSTTHLDGLVPGTDAAYVCFGEGIGQMNGTVMDVHGAGAQRGDPKTGSRNNYPMLGMGPQGDSRRVFNMVRCVRDGANATDTVGEADIIQPASGGQGPGGPSGANSDAAGGTPPQEAQDACADLAVGTACTVETPEGALDGTCAQLGGVVACAPEGGAGTPPPQDEQGPPQDDQEPPQDSGDKPAPPAEAIAACAGSQPGSSCQVTTPTGPITGSCQSVGADLACVPAGGPPAPSN